MVLIWFCQYPCRKAKSTSPKSNIYLGYRDYSVNSHIPFSFYPNVGTRKKAPLVHPFILWPQNLRQFTSMNFQTLTKCQLTTFVFHQHVLTVGKQQIQCSLLERIFWIKNQAPLPVSYMTLDKPLSNFHLLQRYRIKWLSHVVGRNSKWYNTYEDNLNLAPWIPLLGIFPYLHAHWLIYKPTHCSSAFNSKKVTQILNYRGLVKQTGTPRYPEMVQVHGWDWLINVWLFWFLFSSNHFQFYLIKKNAF